MKIYNKNLEYQHNEGEKYAEIFKIGKEEKIKIVSPVPEVVNIKLIDREYFLTLRLEGSEIDVNFEDFTKPDKIKILFPFTYFKYNVTKEESISISRALMIKYQNLLQEPMDFVGFENNKYIAPNFTHSSEGKKQNQFILENKRIKFLTPKTDKLTPEEIILLKENLLHLRSLRAVSWFIATYFNHKDIKFPILSAFNTTGLGKTEGSELLGKITMGYSKVACRTLTEAQIKRIMTLSNSLPFIIDDYKHNENYKFDLESFMRALFEGDPVFQATVSKQMIEFELNRPVVITGENPLKNMSSNNRMIPMGTEQVKKEIWDIFKDTDILEKFGYLVLKERLKYTDNQVLSFYKSCVKILSNKYKNIDGRSIENLAVIRMGLIMYDRVLGTKKEESFDYTEILEIRGVTDIKGFILDVIKTAQDYNDVEFINLQKENFILVTDKEIRVNSSKFFTLYLDMKRRGSFTGEEITSKAFKTQVLSLTGEKDYKPISINGVKSKGFVIKL